MAMSGRDLAQLRATCPHRVWLKGRSTGGFQTGGGGGAFPDLGLVRPDLSFLRQNLVI